SIDMNDMCQQLMGGAGGSMVGAGIDPLANLGSLKNDLLLPGTYGGHDDGDGDFDDDLMLGTTPNLMSNSVAAQAGLAAHAQARGMSGGHGMASVHHHLRPGMGHHHGVLNPEIHRIAQQLQNDDDDELMGMSPDVPSIIGGGGASSFGDFLSKAFVVGNGSLAAAAAAPGVLPAQMAQHQQQAEGR
ncbi:hypothetical protein FOA52_003714, partial [Chlamydomonas sp. UWO 241]